MQLRTVLDSQAKPKVSQTDWPIPRVAVSKELQGLVQTIHPEHCMQVNKAGSFLYLLFRLIVGVRQSSEQEVIPFYSAFRSFIELIVDEQEDMFMGAKCPTWFPSTGSQ